jgi:hypothetical protein
VVLGFKTLNPREYGYHVTIITRTYSEEEKDQRVQVQKIINIANGPLVIMYQSDPSIDLSCDDQQTRKMLVVDFVRGRLLREILQQLEFIAIVERKAQ